MTADLMTVSAPPIAVPPPTPARPEAPERDWWVIAGMTVAATSAAVASFTGLEGLAALAGWPSRLAWLLPVTVDAYAMTSARVWLATSRPSRSPRRRIQTLIVRLSGGTGRPHRKGTPRKAAG